MNGNVEGLLPSRGTKNRKGGKGRSARRIAMEARRRQDCELGCISPSAADRTQRP